MGIVSGRKIEICGCQYYCLPSKSDWPLNGRQYESECFYFRTAWHYFRYYFGKDFIHNIATMHLILIVGWDLAHRTVMGIATVHPAVA